MTNKDFIRNNAFQKGKEKKNGNLIKGEDGTIFSYGCHFPLLFKIAGVSFINNEDYCNSTKRHQGLALLSFPGSLEVNLSGSPDYSKKNVLSSLQNEINDNIDMYNLLKRKNTKKANNIKDLIDCNRFAISVINI